MTTTDTTITNAALETVRGGYTVADLAGIRYRVQKHKRSEPTHGGVYGLSPWAWHAMGGQGQPDQALLAEQDKRAVDLANKWGLKAWK